MDILRIPSAYYMQIKYLSNDDSEYVLKTIFGLSNGDKIMVEDSMRGGLVLSIWREAIQMENKARAKKGGKRLSGEVATLTRDTDDTLGSPKRATKSSQVTSSQVKSSQVKEIIISKDITTEVETPVYGNKEINDTLIFLQKAVGIDEFKESKNRQRIYGKHFCNYISKVGKDNFIERLKGILSDDFKSKNCNSIKTLYSEVKAYIYNPALQKEEPKITTY